jgi:hypothetical protein
MSTATTNGLILLAFIAIVVALIVARVRRRIGFAVTGRALAVTVSGFVIVVLILWATGR